MIRMMREMIMMITLINWTRRNPNIRWISPQNPLPMTMFGCRMFCMDVNCHGKDRHQAKDRNFPFEKKDEKICQSQPIKQTYSPAPMEILSLLPLMKKMFSPVHGKHSKIG